MRGTGPIPYIRCPRVREHGVVAGRPGPGTSDELGGMHMTAPSPDAAPVTRRDFVKAGAAAGLAASVLPAARALGSSAGVGAARPMTVGVIGCGGRGTGAAVNALEAHPDVRVVALADLFQDRLRGCRDYLREHHQERASVADDLCFTGFDAYQRLLDAADLTYVVLATPPHFRPIHFDAAIRAGAHVFMEKPVAVDPAGVRRVIDAGSAADAKGLSVVTGTQRRHEGSYLEAMRRLADGAIGDVVSAECYWNQGGLWVHERQPAYTEMEWQCRNWLYFNWLSGDHICEQHIHNLDVVNWAMGGHPVRCIGMGGRQVRVDERYGNIFDHFAVTYEYEDGRQALSMCRQIDGCHSRVDEVIHARDGRLRTSSGRAAIHGRNPWEWRGRQANPYVQEHKDLIASIRSEGERLNEARRTAESTLTAIMGRMSAYTGKMVTWDQALQSQLDLTPRAYAFGDVELAPALDAVAVPGRTPLV